LTAQSIVSAATAIDAIMSCESLSAIGDSVLRPVVNMIEADSAVYMRLRHDSLGRPFICESSYVGSCPDSLDQYEAGYFVDDPVLKPLLECAHEWREIRDPVRFHLSSQVKQRALHSSDYFRNFLKPFDLGDIIGIAFPLDCDGPQMLCLGIHRSSERVRFDQSEVLALGSVERPLRMALETLCLRASIAEQSMLIEAMDSTETSTGFAVFDRSLHMLRGSKRLRELFTTRFGHREAFARLRKGAAALDGGSSPTDAAIVLIELGQGIAGELRRVESNHDRHYVLIVRDANADKETRRQIAQTLPRGEKITAREQQVIDEVARGGSNARIAEALGISVRTVENHLRAVYEKLGINSRTQLVSRFFAS
tara:strand:+ start:29787 stop:30887 length:1101 start_codon:yes stop_codon:yes gene_type:complete